MTVPIHALPYRQYPIRLVQVSDPHLFSNTAHCLLGMNTEDSLQQVTQLIEQQQPHIDAIIATGDIAQSPSSETYQRFHQHLQRFNAPHYWLQGNHDLDLLFCQNNATAASSPVILALGVWRIIMLNSSVDHEVAGEITASELAWLSQALQQCVGHFCIVALHHHPVAVKSHWLDQHMLTNNADFWRIIEQFDDVKHVVHGHVHQHVDTQRQGVRILACPSTCIQFKPHSHDFALDTAPPGYRWFSLHADGHIDTGVERLEKMPQGVDFHSLGY